MGMSLLSTLFFMSPFIIIPLVIAGGYALWTNIKEPVEALRGLKSQPVGNISREEARLGISRLARSAQKVCTIVFWFDVCAFVVLVLVVAAGIGFSETRELTLQALLVGPSGESNVSPLVEAAMALVLFRRLAQFFGKIGETGSPFTVDTARELGRIGGYLFYMWIVPLVVGNAVSFAAFALVDPAAEDSFSWVGSGQLPTLLVSLFVIFLARIFEYGCVLQQEDDGLV